MAQMTDRLTALDALAELERLRASEACAWQQWNDMQDLLGASKEVNFAFDEVAGLEVQLSDALAEVEGLRAEIGRLRSIVRVNMLRHVPGVTHAEIDAILNGQAMTDRRTQEQTDE